MYIQAYADGIHSGAQLTRQNFHFQLEHNFACSVWPL